jgi:hypothetical protein
MSRRRGSTRQRLALVAMAGVIALAAAACKPALTGNTTGPIGFESTDSPAYTTGTINNQNGWSSLGAAGSGCAVYDHAVSSVSAAGTHPGDFGFGGQSLRMSDAVTSGCFGDQTFSAPTTDEAGETTADNAGLHSGGTRQGFFQASWSFADAGNPFATQDGLHVVASPDRGDGARMSWIEMQDCSTTIDPNINECQSGQAGLEVDFYEYDHGVGNFVFHNIVSGLSRFSAHTIQTRMWFFEGANNDVVQVCVDTTHCITGHSWEDFYRDGANCDPACPTATPTVDSVLFRTGGTADPANAGNGFFIDNFSARSGNYTGAAFSVAAPPSLVEGNAGSTNDPFTVTLSEPLPFTTTVHYATANDTATAPSDYTPTSGTLTFAPFQTSAIVNVPVIGDTIDEPLNETFKLNLSNPTSTGLDTGSESFGHYAALDTSSATATILDDDSTLRISDASQPEGNSGTSLMPFTVTLDNASAVPVSVHFQTVNGSATAPSDYVAASGTFTFAPGVTSRTVNIAIKGDTTVEPNENFLVTLSSPTNGVIADANGVGTIVNDD